MKLNKLISKYLDGELSPSEDSILRDGLKQDTNLKQSFDKYVDIHHAMKKEAATITVPEHLFVSTEQFTLGRQQLKQNIETKISKNNTPIKSVAKVKTYRKAFATTMLLMLISIYNISDNYKANYLDFSGLNSSVKSNTIQNELKSIKTRKAVSKSNAQVLENNSTINLDEASLIELNQVPNLNSELFESNLVNVNSQDDFLSNNSGETANNDIKNTADNDGNNQFNNLNETNPIISNQASQFANPNGFIRNQNNIDLQFVIKHQNIALQSTFANSTSNINIGGASDVKISSFTQSINYEVNNSLNLGMEVGYNNYDYSTQMMTNLSLYTSESNTGKSGSIQVLDPTKSIESKIKVKLNVNQNYKQLFASFFLDKTLFKEDNIAANARIGIGSSMDGLLLYGRAGVSYQIISNLTANVGAEFRMFNTNLPNATAGLTQSANSLMLTYGLQYSM